MKRGSAAVVMAAVLACGGARAAVARQQQPAPLRLAASTFASVEVHLNARKANGQWYAEDAGFTGPSRIVITYGQPHARGRKVEGGLIPTDTVWRFGANQATTLHTDVDLRLGDLAVAPGDYSLFVLHARDAWWLVVNRATGQWGTDYDATRDLGRVALAARTLAEPEGSLSVYLVPDAAQPASGAADLSGVLRIKWGVTELSARWRVQP